MKNLNKKDVKMIVQEILAQADMEGLIEYGCGRDEYSPEAKVIANYIVENADTIDVNILSCVCAECFNRYFFPNYSQYDFVEVAKCILMNLEEE